jgi:DNA-directed RNA polymerase subunit RPC12/RpoP
MRVVCPQCGAPIEALTESRFYRCHYCTSSFLVQGGRELPEFVILHRRDDRHAWSALKTWLEISRVMDPIKRDGAEFMQFPFWYDSSGTRERVLVPAREHPFSEVSSVTLPAGDLVYLEEKEEYAEPLVSLSEAVSGCPPGSGEPAWNLLYLPLYFLRYRVDERAYTAIVSGADGRVFAAERPEQSAVSLSSRHLAMMAGYALLLVVEGVLIRDALFRTLAFLVTTGCLYPVFLLLLKREAAS